MISKAQLKKLRGLANKKQRKAQGQFLVQGEKSVVELLHSSLSIVELFASQEFCDKHESLIGNTTTTLCSLEELSKASSLSANDSAIAVVQIPTTNALFTNEPIIALDDINDPGNLGTILRVADWYGINNVIVSENTADEFNPKVISATMGAFTRVSVHRMNLEQYLATCNKPVMGAYLNGTSVHDAEFPENTIILMGNESHGIAPHLERFVTQPITIPKYGQSESLNVAMATGIILDNLKRKLS